MPTGNSEAGAVPEPVPAPSRRPVAGGDLLPGGSRAFPTEPSDLGVRANVNVTVGLDTLLGLNEEPGELEGHGPISAVMARALAFGEGSTWRRLVTDPVTGQLLDYGRTRYKAPAPLDEFARARDVLCRTVNCDHPARLCDLDHTERFPEGPTSAWNLHSHCRRHHRLKHEGGWRHEVLDDPAFPPGTLKITSPTGHVYYSHAPAIRPIARVDEETGEE